MSGTQWQNFNGNCCQACGPMGCVPNFKVEISGIENGNWTYFGDVVSHCGNCDELNKTYKVYNTLLNGGTWGDGYFGQGANCVWYRTFAQDYFGGTQGEWKCDNDQWQRLTSMMVFIDIEQDGSYSVKVQIWSDFDWPSYGPIITYYKNYGTGKSNAPNCAKFDNEEIPYKEQKTGYTPPGFHEWGCDGSNSTCKLTAIPWPCTAPTGTGYFTAPINQVSLLEEQPIEQIWNDETNDSYKTKRITRKMTKRPCNCGGKRRGRFEN